MKMKFSFKPLDEIAKFNYPEMDDNVHNLSDRFDLPNSLARSIVRNWFRFSDVNDEGEFNCYLDQLYKEGIDVIWSDTLQRYYFYSEQYKITLKADINQEFLEHLFELDDEKVWGFVVEDVFRFF